MYAILQGGRRDDPLTPNYNDGFKKFAITNLGPISAWSIVIRQDKTSKTKILEMSFWKIRWHLSGLFKFQWFDHETWRCTASPEICIAFVNQNKKNANEKLSENWKKFMSILSLIMYT